MDRLTAQWLEDETTNFLHPFTRHWGEQTGWVRLYTWSIMKFNSCNRILSKYHFMQMLKHFLANFVNHSLSDAFDNNTEWLNLCGVQLQLARSFKRRSSERCSDSIDFVICGQCSGNRTRSWRDINMEYSSCSVNPLNLWGLFVVVRNPTMRP